MKKRVKDRVDCIELLETTINSLNCKANEEIKKHYTYKFLKGKDPVGNNNHYNILKVYVNDLETNKRTVIFENKYMFNNPAERITVAWKKELIKSFLYHCMGFFLVNIEHQSKKQDVQAAIEHKIALDANR